MHHQDNASPYNPTTEPITYTGGGGVAYTPAQPVTIQPGTSVHVFSAGASVGPDPCNITCQLCGETGITRTDKGASTRTHLFALVLCLVGCWPCAPCVYCVDSLLATKHYCGKCNAFVGVYNSKLF
ncbi:lipopolysaccharide-induced tumor necrosis factor-alpha factor homolog [Athalia rosae]|uniref:lipopolysaccharide-induced tumor necrosis factor-alpha factor homolog n=1 Tax=Athalia rosae TaxID=37344 RepID=UPI0006268C6A|nr:lipopolysaccharide-induced tumor necrosis factor-alpha factor homolog [Athalia rosae]